MTAKNQLRKRLQFSLNIIISRHDERAAHLVKLMPTHIGGTVRRIRVCAHAEAELIISLNKSMFNS
jgi:hypothetical protein